MRAPAVVNAALLGLSGALVAAPARPRPAAAIALEWSAPAGCPRQSDVLERVRKLAGTARSTDNALQADGRITREGDGRFRLTLVVRSGGLVGERKIESGSCDDLAGAAAVALALLLRSEEPLHDFDELPSSEPPKEGRARATRAEPSRGTSEDASDASASGAPLESERSSGQDDAFVAAPRSVRALLEAPLVASSLGPLAEPALGFGLAGGVSFEGFRFLGEGLKWLEQRVVSEELPGFAAEVERATVTLRACRPFRWERFALAPCLTLSLEHLSATGTGPDVSPQTRRALWVAPGAGAQGLLLLSSRFNLVVSLDTRIETSRPRLSIEGVGDVDQLGPVAVTVVLGPEWIL